MSPSITGGESEGQFQVRSADGTRIAVWVDGAGPPIVLVHGILTDHTAWAVPVDELGKHFTTFAMDRRGFGASEDVDEYSIERDFEDVAAVVEAVAGRRDGPLTLWGHSYGANCAMGGANSTSVVDHLVLYEPGLGQRYPEGAIEAVESALEAGDRETAVVRLLEEVLEMSAVEIDYMRSSPRWPLLVAGVHTAPRECRVEASWVYEPGTFAGIDAPTLLLLGSASPDQVIAATHQARNAIPNARIHQLEGHAHFAHRTDPDMVVSVIRDFVS